MSAHTLYYSLMDNGVDLEDEELQKKYGAYSGKDLAQVFYDRYFETYKGVESYIENRVKKARKNGFVTSITGRRRRLPMIHSSDRKQRSYGERSAANSPVQSSASDIIMNAQIRLENSQELKDLGVQQLMQIHDK